MNIQIGTYIGNPKSLHKQFVVSQTLDVNVLSDCSVHNPHFIVSYFSGIEHATYCSAFGNYYFIDDVIVSPGGRTTIVCREDVLMSLQGIELVKAYLVRTESNTSTKYMVDMNIHNLVKTNMELLKFNDVFSSTDQTYVMTVLGGAKSNPVSTPD